MYFLGVSVYIAAMVTDLAAALDDLEKVIREDAAGKQAARLHLANAIRFHNEIIA